MTIEELFELDQTKDYPSRHRLADLLTATPIDRPYSFTSGKSKFVKLNSRTANSRTTHTITPGNRAVREMWDCPDHFRAIKSMILLENFNTQRAGTIIKSMGSGHPKSALTKFAQSISEGVKGANQPEDFSANWTELKPKLITNSTLERFEQVQTSTRALLELAKHPAKTTELFAQNLVPLKMSRQEVVDLLSKLGSEKEEVWRDAFAKLSTLDPRLAMSIEGLFELPQAKAYPARHRLANVLSRTPPEWLPPATAELRVEKVPNNILGVSHNICFGDQDSGSGECIPIVGELTCDRRTIYALVLLESFDTPEADKLIELMATGNAKAIPTQVAREILEKRKSD